MPEFDEQQFHRAYYLLAVYAHELILRQESMPLSVWKRQVKDEKFDDTVADLVEQGLVLEMGGDQEQTYAITEEGQALVWLYSDVMREIWKRNMGGEGDQLIDFLVANLDAYAEEQRELARQEAEGGAAEQPVEVAESQAQD